MEHVPHERPQYPIPARLVETKLEVLRVQIQVRLERRQPEQNLLGRVIGKLDSVGAAEDEGDERSRRRRVLVVVVLGVVVGFAGAGDKL